MSFRREYKATFAVPPHGHLRIAVLGRHLDKQTPYLRISDKNGNYLGSISGATLYHLRNAISKAIEK